MKARSAALQGVLAIAGLVAAYFTWQRPPEQTDGDVVVLGTARSDLRTIKFEDDRRVVEIVPDKGTVWIRQAEKPMPPAPVAAAAGADGGTTVAAAAQAEPSAPPKLREFKGNESAERLLERFAPLQAARALGVLAPEKLEEVGLAGSQRQLEVVTGSGSRRFALSKAEGTGAPYLRGDDGNVFLVRGTLVSDLEFASSRLVDRRLHTFSEPEFDALSISSGNSARKLVKAGDKWASADGQGAPDEFATNWHDKVWRLLGIEVLGRGEAPAAGEPQVQVRIDYLRGQKPVGYVELGQSGTDTFARTEHTAGWVRLHGSASQILTERDQVLEKR